MRQLFNPLVGLSHPLSYKHPQSLADRLHGNASEVRGPVCFAVGADSSPLAVMSWPPL
jgi:hypothetical protein